MPSSHLILCCPLLLLPPIPPSIRVFFNESALCMRWPEYWSFSFSISPSSEHPGLISFRMDWLDLLAVQGTLRSSPTPQFKSINFSVLSFLHSPTLTSIHNHWKNLLSCKCILCHFYSFYSSQFLSFQKSGKEKKSDDSGKLRKMRLDGERWKPFSWPFPFLPGMVGSCCQAIYPEPLPQQGSPLQGETALMFKTGPSTFPSLF